MKTAKNKAFQGTIAFAAASLFLSILANVPDFSSSVRRGMVLGIGLAFLNGLLSLLSLHWAFSRSPKVFYGTFFGGMLWKLGVLFALFFYLSPGSAVHSASALASLGAVTFLLNVLEIRFLPRQGVN